jgi:hypothetical protein
MSEKSDPFSYTVEDFKQDVGDLTDNEISMLAENYPSYRIKNWRMTLLEGIKLGKQNDEIFFDKLKAKEIDLDSPQSEGGHRRMIDNKLRRAAIRLLYLRHIDDGKSRRQANAVVWKVFPNLTQNAIAFSTRKR